MQDPDTGVVIASLEKLSAKITIISGDIAVPESLRSILQIFITERPLCGVVHTAGVVDSGTLPFLTTQEVRIAGWIYILYHERIRSR